MMTGRMSGKGSKRRPKVISDDEFADRWERAFGRKKGTQGRPTTKPLSTPPFLLLLGALFLAGCTSWNRLPPDGGRAAARAELQYRASLEALHGEYGPARAARGGAYAE